LIDPRTDSDFFEFTGVAGQVVAIILSETTNSAIELWLRAWDPNGVEIVNTSPGGNNYHEITLGVTGTYTIGISESGINEVGGYMLQLENISSKIRPCIPWGSFEDDFIDQRTDSDFFSFEGISGNLINIILSETTNSAIELWLRVWDPAGVEIVNTFPGGNIFVPLTLLMDGTYTIGIGDSGINETGGYTLQLECPFGDCPTCPGTVVRNYIDTTSCADTNTIPDGCPDVATLLMQNGESVVRINDGCDGSLTRQIEFFNANWRSVAIACIPDINFNGISELVVLGVNKNNGDVAVRIMDAQTKELLNHIWFYNNNWDAKGFTGVMDTNFNSVYELAVLAVRRNDGFVQTKLKDALTKEMLKIINLPK